MLPRASDTTIGQHARKIKALRAQDSGVAASHVTGSAFFCWLSGELEGIDDEGKPPISQPATKRHPP